MYPKAKEERIQPWEFKDHLNFEVMGIIAIGRMMRSAALMKLATEHSPMIRDVFIMACVIL